jgi:tetratricopeptide (TPR) repeat protein
LTLQSEVARQVATQLAGQLGSSAGAFKPPTRDPQAYDLFLKARLEAESSIRGPATPVEVLQRVEGLLSGALAHDPDFAQARAQRAQMRTLQFVYNYDSAQHAMPLAQKDLEAALRLAPEDPDVLFVKAAYLLFFERDPTHAIAALEAGSPEALDPIWLAASAEMYYSVGRFETAIQRTQRALTLDPKNVLVYAELIRAFLLARKPAEAVRVADLASVEFPADFPLWRDRLRWDFTGLGSPAALTGSGPLTQITASTTVDSANFFLFLARVAHRYPEMSAYLGQTRTETIRGFFTAGAQPVAELRGWVHLLLGDRAAAARDGREVLNFVAHTQETKWNRASLDLLTAEGNTFLGDKHRAIAAAEKALRDSESVTEQQHVPPLAAAVYAWSGAADEAASLLEQLSVRLPAVMFFGPATIVHDPLYSVPLAGNPRYAALTAKLEAQMAATRLP